MSRPCKIPISVTQSDIDQGKPGDPTSCPVALACRRVLNHSIHVRSQRIDIDGDGFIINPTEVSLFIGKFDSSYQRPNVKPFRFKLPLTAEQVAFLKL